MKCNHIIGTWSSCDEGGVFEFSEWIHFNSDMNERFVFCPRCGENISELKLPRRRKPNKKMVQSLKERDSVTESFIRESAKMGSDIWVKLCKKPALLGIIIPESK